MANDSVGVQGEDYKEIVGVKVEHEKEVKVFVV